MNPTQQFYNLVASRYYELEDAKLERAEIRLNINAAYRRHEITEAQRDELLAELDAEELQ